MGTLVKTAELLISEGIAKNTQKAYSRGLRSLQEFRRQYNLPDVWPVPLNHVIWYIAFHHIKGSAFSTITNYLSAISYFHKIANFEDQTKQFIVKNMLNGYKKNKLQKDSRFPVTLDILVKFPQALNIVCQTQYEAALFKAAFYLSFFGLLRISELVFNVDAPMKTLSNDDIWISHNKLYVTIKYSKNDQCGKGVTLIIDPITNNEICPVRATIHYKRLRPESVPHFFCHANKSPLTRYQFSSVLGKVIANIGLPGTTGLIV